MVECINVLLLYVHVGSVLYVVRELKKNYGLDDQHGLLRRLRGNLLRMAGGTLRPHFRRGRRGCWGRHLTGIGFSRRESVT